MNHARLAATAGILACLATVATVAAPYAVLPAEQASAIGEYYGRGLVGPFAVGLLGLMGAIIFAAGREGRSDPSLVAGVMLALGLVSLFVAIQWALSFRPDLVASREALEFMTDHRWIVVAGTALMTVAAAWYATSLGLLPVPEPRR